MITRLVVRGFRALRDFVLDLPEGAPVVLVGANGTGKTTILEVFDLLSDIANGGGAQRALQRRGGFDAVATRGGDGRVEIIVEFVAGPETQPTPARYRLALAGDGRGGWSVEADELDLREGGAWREVARNNPGLKVYRERASAELVPLRLDPHETLLSARGGHESWVLVDALLLPLRRLRYVPSFEVRANWARRPGDPTARSSVVMVDHATELDAHGANLLNVLHTLSSESEHRAIWSRLVGEFQREFPYVRDVSFPPSGGGRGQVVMKWRDTRSNQWMFFDEMSDGMISFLTLLTAVITTPWAGAIALDEPDVHLHPSLLARIVDNLEDAAERHTVFVATHADRLLDFLSDPVRSIHVVRYEAEAGVTAQRLDETSLRAWLSQYRASELRHMGLLDTVREGNGS